jgi:hypothetical protein
MSTAINNDCCGETVLPHPFSNTKGRRRQLSLFDAENPIPNEVKDTEKLQKVFDELKLVPYAGHNNSTGHSLLVWYLMLEKLSPMHGACIEKLKKYVVGSRAKFVRAEDPEYDPGTEDQEMTAGESLLFETAVKEHVTFEGGVRKFHQSLQGSKSATGNAYAELSISTVNGQSRANVRYLKPTEALYKVTKPGEMKVMALSPIWEWDYLKRNPPKLVPLAPNFVEEGGVKRTIFHLKSGGGNWYGRPETQASDLYKYREVQDSLYIIKQSAANFVGQLIIEVEDDGAEPAIDNEDAKRSGFDSFADRMEQNYTNKGDDPQSVFVTARPFGSRPMFVFQLKPNTNENWYKVTGEMSEQKILRSHGLTLRFMGFEAANGFATDTFIGDYVMNVEPVINEQRTTLMTFTNSILSLIWEEIGRPELNQFSLTFQSPIQSQIEQFKTVTPQANGNPDNNNAV